MLKTDPKLKDRVKLIGIGAGNSTYEVDVFRKKYQIPFPLFEDGDFVIHKQVGEVRTPYFIGVKISKGKPAQVFFSQLGDFQNPESFMDRILKSAGIRKGGAA